MHCSQLRVHQASLHVQTGEKLEINFFTVETGTTDKIFRG